MRCLILIALSLALANASWYNKNRFSQLLRGYQSQKFGGLHDIIGQGQDECSPWNPEQCYQDDDYTGFGRSQWGQQCQFGQCDQDQWNQQCQGIECLDQTTQWQQQCQGGQCDQDQWQQQCQGGQCDQDQWDQQCQGGQCDDVDQFQNQQYGWQDQFQDLDTDDFTQNEFDQIGYGSPFQQKQQQQFQFQQQLGGAQCSPNPRYLPQLENINCQLATTLYTQAKRERDDKNTVVSPAAVLLALGALNVGARSHTKKEIGITSKVGGTRQAIQGLNALHQLLKKGGQQSFDGQHIQDSFFSRNQWGQQACIGGQCTEIKPITGIFLSQTTPVQQQFIQTVQGCLGVKVSKCDFQRQPQQCRQQINQWVSSKSQNKMPRLVPQDGITDNTKMLVVSALQLKAKWGQQFRNHQTKQGVFQPLDSNKVKVVPVMQKRGVFKYHEDEMVKVVGIPTQGNELTMYVILPKCKKCLPEVEKEQLIEGDQLKHLLDNCDQKRAKVNVQLPKFQIKHKLDAKQTLLKKGMINMHEQNTADFSGITGCQECSQQAKYNLRRPLGQRNQLRQGQDWTKQAQIHVNKFLHQATIKVTDSGITAAGPQDIYQDSFEQQQYYGQQQNQFDQDEDDVDQYEQNPFTTGRDRFDEITGLNRFGQGLGFTKSFNAKHPFAFVVRHNPTKQVLLFGRVIDAGQKQQQSVGQWEQIQGVY